MAIPSGNKWQYQVVKPRVKLSGKKWCYWAVPNATYNSFIYNISKNSFMFSLEKGSYNVRTKTTWQ